MGGVPPIGKFPHKDFTCVLMGVEPNVKNPGYRDLQGKFFGRYAPDQNTDLRPNGGALMASLEGGEFAVDLGWLGLGFKILFKKFFKLVEK